MKEMVVYQAEYGDNEIWVRPRDMFFEKVQIAGKFVDRYEAIDKIKK